MKKNFNRITLIVLDSLGMGEMPDAALWGDAGSDTLGHILESRQVNLPNLQRMGLGNIRALAGVPPADEPRASFGRCALRSNGKDTTTGHWEMAGIILEHAFPTYPNGFPEKIINRFISETGVPGVLGNMPASGTEIIKELGEEHVKTGNHVYTSADSVFQIAAHEEIISVPKLYEISRRRAGFCRAKTKWDASSRARSWETLAFKRTENRHDYAVPPPRENLLLTLSDAGLDVICIGKVASIYDAVGVTTAAKNNDQSIDQTVRALNNESRGLIFSNLVDFDMLYGHRRDTEGYARALEHFDTRLPEIESAMRDDDIFIITADHGNDPTRPGSDPTREYAPLIVYGKNARAGVNLGDRHSLSDIGQTVADNFGLKLTAGQSFLQQIA